MFSFYRLSSLEINVEFLHHNLRLTKKAGYLVMATHIYKMFVIFDVNQKADANQKYFDASSQVEFTSA